MKKKIVYVVGGLGSQMSAYALWLALRKRFKNVEYDLSWFEENPDCHQGSELPKIFGLADVRSNRYLTAGLSKNASFLSLKILFWLLKRIHVIHWLTSEEVGYDYDERVFQDRYGVTFYCNCWTSYKYFLDVEHEIRESFVFPEMPSIFREKFSNLASNNELVAVHVRCGDTLSSPAFHGVVPPSYFRDAVAIMTKRVNNPLFLVFSDDIDWCKKNLDCSRLVFAREYFPEIREAYQDMQVMALCNHNIISNSSFSWWAAYLNPNKGKIVVAPRKWVMSEYGMAKNIKLSEMVPPGWTIIENI
jgi:hypothetical protein